MSLQRIFARERDEAHAALETESRALARYARIELERTMQQRLMASRARIDAATHDFLVDDSDLLLVTDGKQVLPRPISFAPGEDKPAAVLLEELRTGASPRGAEGPWAERLALLGELNAAAAAHHEDVIVRVVRSLLGHRARYVLPVTQEVPYMVHFLRLLMAGTTPAPELLTGLLRDGLHGGHGQRVEGLQSLLLAKRAQMTREDFALAAREITELSELAAVDHHDFDREAGHEPTPEVKIDLPLSGPVLASGRFFVEPFEETGARGLTVDLDGVLSEIRSKMSTSGLLDDDERLRRVGDLRPAQPLAALELTIASPSRIARRAAIGRRYRLKTALAAATGALAIAVVVLAVIVYRRKQRLLQSKSDFVATVSHELRTPLAALRVMAETLERRLANNPEARDFPARMVGDVDRLTFLVENILSFNRLEKGGTTASMGEVQLTELAAELQRDVVAFTRKPVEIRVEGEARLVADADLMKLLFSNLVANACKYNEREKILVELAARGHTITVRDNGIGIARELHERVFLEFFRVGRRGGGFGLGLAICRRIMALHRGTIRVESSSTSGTCFELTFPFTLEIIPTEARTA